MSYLGGTRAGRTITPRVFSLQPGLQQIIPGPCVIDAGTATYPHSFDGGNTGYTWELRAGCIMAQVTASKKWVPCGRTTIAAGGSGSGSGAGSATVPVVDARFFMAGEKISIIPEVAPGTQGARVEKTIASVDYSANTITFTGAIQYGTGTVVYKTYFADGTTSAAGCEIPRGILKEARALVNLQDPSDAAAGTRYDRDCQIVIRDYVNEDYILGDYAAARAGSPTAPTTAIPASYLQGILWDDLQQGG